MKLKGFLLLIEAGIGIFQFKLHDFYGNGSKLANSLVHRAVMDQLYFPNHTLLSD